MLNELYFMDYHRPKSVFESLLGVANEPEFVEPVPLRPEAPPRLQDLGGVEDVLLGLRHQGHQGIQLEIY